MAAMKALLLFIVLSLLHISALVSARRLSETSSHGEINNEMETQFTTASEVDAHVLGAKDHDVRAQELQIPMVCQQYLKKSHHPNHHAKIDGHGEKHDIKHDCKLIIEAQKKLENDLSNKEGHK